MKKSVTSTFWGVQTTIKKSGKKVLCWNWKGSKSLYWTSDLKAPPPALFETRKEAKKAILKSSSCKEKIHSNLFTKFCDVDYTSTARAVKVHVLSN